MRRICCSFFACWRRSEEHTSELQSHSDLHSFPTRRSSDLTGCLRIASRSSSPTLCQPSYQKRASSSSRRCFLHHSTTHARYDDWNSALVLEHSPTCEESAAVSSHVG